jgi:transposase InsO family protein
MRISSQYWAPGLHKVVQQVAEQCIKCQYRNVAAVKNIPQGEVSAMNFNHVVAIDFLKLPLSSYAREDVLTIVDVFTRFTVMVVTPDQTAASTVDALQKYWFAYFGFPRILHSDNGSSFRNDLVNRLCEHYGITQRFITPYRPTSNGLCERTNRLIVEYLSKVIAGQEQSTYRHLVAAVQMCLNSRRLKTLGGLTPLEAVTGNMLAIPKPAEDAELIFHDLADRLQHLQELRQRLRQIHEQRTEQIDIAKALKLLDTRTFSVGDLVLRRVPRNQRPLGKLALYYDGPHRIEEVTDPSAMTYIVRQARRVDDSWIADGEQRRVHIRQLKPYRDAEAVDAQMLD